MGAPIIIGALASMWLAKALYNNSVIDRHEAQQEAASVGAKDAAADQRANDTIRNAAHDKEAQDAIQSVPASDAQLRLDCLRLSRVGIDASECRRLSSN